MLKADDVIRDADVTGVQTCALPISASCSAEPDEHLDAARASEEHEAAIDDAGDQQDVERVTPPERGDDLFHGRLARATRSATATASLVSATSWVRISAAPLTTASAVAASDPARRSAGSVRPVRAPMNDFRDTPTARGRPRSWSSARPARTRTSHSCHG